MRKRGRIDANHGEIVDALRDVGATVQSIASIGKGCPDLLVGFRGLNYLFEVKPEGETPNEAEWKWINEWRGSIYVVRSAQTALKFIGAIR